MYCYVCSRWFTGAHRLLVMSVYGLGKVKTSLLWLGISGVSALTEILLTALILQVFKWPLDILLTDAGHWWYNVISAVLLKNSPVSWLVREVKYISYFKANQISDKLAYSPTQKLNYTLDMLNQFWWHLCFPDPWGGLRLSECSHTVV